MSLNLAPRSRLYAGGGGVPLSVEELSSLTDGVTVASGISVSAETLEVVCDLGARYDVSSVVYHRSPGTSETVVVSGKQGTEESHEWVVLSTTSSASQVVAALADSENKYRLVRVAHTVSAGTALACELEVFADVTGLGYGLAGSEEKFAVDSGTVGLTVEAIPVYNPDTVSHTVYCLLDPEDPFSAGCFLGTTSGSLSPLYGTGLAVPDDFAFSAGVHTNTVEVSGTVRLSPAQTAGVYYTPVLDISAVAGRRVFFRVATASGVVDEAASVDSRLTIGVRMANSAPADAGWVSGQTSVDGNWSVVSGTLPFSVVENGRILDPQYLRYFQARATFASSAPGLTPVLYGVGVEAGHALEVPACTAVPIYMQSSYLDHAPNRTLGVVTWYFESRNGVV